MIQLGGDLGLLAENVARILKNAKSKVDAARRD
jgi:hypothetical protein